MANWYTTEFCITGSQTDREAAMTLLKELPKDKDGTLPLDELAQALGCDPEKTFVRGYIEDFKEREDYIESIPRQPISLLIRSSMLCAGNSRRSNIIFR